MRRGRREATREVYPSRRLAARGESGECGGGRRNDPPSISVVIPARNEARALPTVLRSIWAQDPPPREVIVVDGGSEDGTPIVAGQNRARVVSSVPGRGVQLHAGALAATGEVLLFLHADTRLPPGALEAILKVLEQPRVLGGRFRIRFQHRNPVLRSVAFFSRFPFSWTSFGDSGFFVRGAVYRGLGGFEPVPLFEDVRFFTRLRGAGEVRVLPFPLTTSCRRFCVRGPLRQLLVNVFLFTAHRLGADPTRLAGWYGSSPSIPFMPLSARTRFPSWNT